MSNIRFVGLDVHADTIAVAVAETGVKFVHWEYSPTGWNQFGNWFISSGPFNTCGPVMRRGQPGMSSIGS